MAYCSVRKKSITHQRISCSYVIISAKILNSYYSISFNWIRWVGIRSFVFHSRSSLFKINASILMSGKIYLNHFCQYTFFLSLIQASKQLIIRKENSNFVSSYLKIQATSHTRHPMPAPVVFRRTYQRMYQLQRASLS